MAGEDTDPRSSTSTTAAPYVFFSFLLEVLLQFLVLVFALDMLDSISYMQLAILSALDMFSYSSYMKMLFTFSLSNRWLVSVNCSYFQQSKNLIIGNLPQVVLLLP